MTATITDGFDLYNGTGAATGIGTEWTQVSITGSAPTASLVTGRFGAGQRLRLTPPGSANNIGGWQRSLRSSYSSLATGFGFRITDLTKLANSPSVLCVLREGTTYHCSVGVNSSGQLVAQRHTTGTSITNLQTTVGQVIFVNQEHYLGIEYVIDDTVGRITVYVDDFTTPVINVTGSDTRNGGNGAADTIMLAAGANAAGTTNYDFDDFYVNDVATALGARRTKTLYGSADILQGFSRSSGAANFSLINEATADGDTSYVQGGLGAVDRYDFDNLGLNPANIDLVQLVAFAESTDAYARRIALQGKFGATVSDGSDFALVSGAYGRLERPLAVNPATGVAFTVSDVDGIQGGPKVTQ